MDVLACPVCFETFDDPQILPGCGHCFCRSCVQQLGVMQSGPRCPTCRQQFRPADVRPNFALQAMLNDYAGQPGLQVADSATLPGGQLVRGTGRNCHAALKKSLVSCGIPDRLADCIAHEDQHIGLRIFLLDNSGSMMAGDGKFLVIDETEEVMFPVACSRWDEVKRMAIDQAEWNMKLGVPCEFVLLNPGPPPLREGIDFVRLDPAQHRGSIASLRQMLDTNGPRGVTPLADRIAEIYARVKTEHAALVAAGQYIMLCIATDGMPTAAHNQRSTSQDRDVFVRQLRRLMVDLPVYVVVRLCTNDSKTVDFYNEIEDDMELPMDVLDDLTGEASEIKQQGNGWFAYTKQLHTIREGGSFLKLLDTLDERRLTETEAALWAQLLMHTDGNEPLPRNKDAFCEAIGELADDAYLVYDAHTMGLAVPVDADGLRHAIVGYWNPVRALSTVLVAVLSGCSGNTTAMMSRNELQVM